MPRPGKSVCFIINLVQDVNTVRGLVYLTARETDAQIVFLVTEAFIKRDRQKVWQREVARMAHDTNARMYLYGTGAEALAVLEDGRGMIFAGAESNLAAHREVSEVFDLAPRCYLRVTLQHGLECVGFLQSREHVISHGRNITFSADMVCGWFEPSALTSLSASQRSKLFVTGPAFLLQRPRPEHGDDGPNASGLVCENLHSVRLKASGDHKSSFIGIFFEFCAKMAARSEVLTLRPHPGGQYVLKHNVALPPNVRLDMRPIYDVALSNYRFGISAPSTVVFDMVLAGIPVGVWRDPGGVMDARNYDGLTEISTLDDWLAFERDVRVRPDMILDRQKAFVRQLAMPTDPPEIYRRFTRLITGSLAGVYARDDSPASGLPVASPRSLGLSGDMLVEAKA